MSKARTLLTLSMAAMLAGIVTISDLQAATPLQERAAKAAQKRAAKAAPRRSARAPQTASRWGSKATPWDLRALGKPPKVHEAPGRDVRGMRSLFYEGADYKGKPTWVFAYYAAPEGKPPTGGWPGVVCAHGGGGTAFSGWVKHWNNQGYAAISMDLEGHLPGTHFFQVEGNYPGGQGHKNAGPSRIDWFGDRNLPDTEQWFYHAVADVIAANSLICSFPEVNARKVGLTGISWGGVIAATVAGVDSRFAFVVPVYGGGFIHESDNDGLAQWFKPSHMNAKQLSDYRTKWDGSAHLPNAKMPMLWVTSIKDPVFQIDIFAKSAAAAGGPSTLCLRPWMIHGHGNGWTDAPEIVAFANSIVKDGPALPKLERPVVDANRIVRTKITGQDITEAWIYRTTSKGVWKNRGWDFIQCSIGKGELVSNQPIPPNTTAFFVYVFKDVGGARWNHSASPLVVME